MNKTIWTQEKIKDLKWLYALYKHRGHRQIIAGFMGMTYNQINSALRRFCKGDEHGHTEG
jgi:hypothetical protein